MDAEEAGLRCQACRFSGSLGTGPSILLAYSDLYTVRACTAYLRRAGRWSGREGSRTME